MSALRLNSALDYPGPVIVGRLPMPVTLGMLPARAYQQVSDMIQHVSHVIYYRRDARADL